MTHWPILSVRLLVCELMSGFLSIDMWIVCCLCSVEAIPGAQAQEIRLKVFRLKAGRCRD